MEKRMEQMVEGQIQDKQTGIEVQLSGQDGNVFGLIGLCTQALRRSIFPYDEKDRIKTEFTSAVFAAESYDEALQLMMTYFEVT